MSLKGPDANDVQKIHAEITQLVNQRLSLTALTITVFGAMIAWLTPKDPPVPGTTVGVFVYVGSLLLTVILFLIFLLNYHLSYMLRTFSTYLVVTESSGWEKDWANFRRKFSNYGGYTQPQTIMFLVLGVASVGFPFILGAVYSLTIEPTWRNALWIIMVLYFVLVLGIGVLHWFNKEGDVRRKWEELKELKEP